MFLDCVQKKKFKWLFDISIKKLQQQAQKYHDLLVNGFSEENDVYVISGMPVTSDNIKKYYLSGDYEKYDGIEYDYLPVLNIPVIRNFILFYNSFIHCFRRCIKFKNNVVICDILNISISFGALFATKLTKTKCIGIVTDIPNKTPKKAKNKLLIIIKQINMFLLNKFDGYVFLTEEMNNLINKKNKPYIVIEGQVDIKMQVVENILENKYNKKVCIYAGGLHKIYGIKYLVDAFLKVDVENSELHIYGDGDFKDELILLCEQTHKVKYFGVKSNDYVVKEQLRATLLINPRPTNEEYTKYSFPSKNMEYMASGTPVLTTKLPGMPKEYYPYIYLIEDETEEGIGNKLKELLSKSKEELHIFGERAKSWVLKEKNNIKQAAKITNMITEVNNGI